MNRDLIQTNDPFDSAFIEDDQNDFFPNIGFGLYYYTQKIYAGIAIPRILEHKEIDSRKHYYFITGALISTSDQWMIKPSVLLKYTKGSSLVYDLSSLLIYKETFWIGAQMRSSMNNLIPEKIFLTHGHADHAKPGHKNVLATKETINIMKIRMERGGLSM